MAAPAADAMPEGLKQAVYAFASFGSAEARIDMDGKVRFWVGGIALAQDEQPPPPPTHAAGAASVKIALCSLDPKRKT